MDKKIEETREFLQMIGMPKAQQADKCDTGNGRSKTRYVME